MIPQANFFCASEAAVHLIYRAKYVSLGPRADREKRYAKVSFSLPEEMRERSRSGCGYLAHIYAGNLPTGSRRSYAKPRTLLVNLW